MGVPVCLFLDILFILDHCFSYRLPVIRRAHVGRSDSKVRYTQVETRWGGDVTYLEWLVLASVDTRWNVMGGSPPSHMHGLILASQDRPSSRNGR